MALPVDMNVLLDASKPTSFTRNGATAGDRGLVDTCGILTQSTAASQPTFDRFNCGAGPCIITGGNGAPKFSQPTFLNATGFAFQIPFSLTIAMRGDGVATAVELSANVSSARGVLVGTDTAAITINGPGGAATFTAPAGWNSSNVAQVVTLTCGGTKATTNLYVNGVAVTLTPAGSDPGTGSATISGFVGQDHAGASPLTGAVAFLGFIPGRVQSVSETTAINAYISASNYFAATTGSVTRNTIACGNSLVVGFQTVASGAPAYGFYQRALAILGARFGSPNNNGFGGVLLTTGLFNVNSQWSTSGVGQIVSGLPNIVVIEGGVNDIATSNPLTVSASNTTGFATAVSMKTVVNAVAASPLASTAGGPHYIVANTISLGSANLFQQAARKLVNDTIRYNVAEWGNANAIPELVDIGADAAISGHQAVNVQPYPYYYTGELTHPAKPGQERWGAILARAILGLGL